MVRECGKYEITVEKLLDIVHSYTDPIRIEVIMGGAWMTCDEARHMRNFYLTKCFSSQNKADTAEKERLLKYYKDVPVWNLTVWQDGPYSSTSGRAFYCGIEAHCHYVDMREGWLAERAERRKEKQREYRKRKRAERE